MATVGILKLKTGKIYRKRKEKGHIILVTALYFVFDVGYSALGKMSVYI